MRLRTLIFILLLSASAFATNYTVKAGGGGSFTTMAACASQMSSNGTGVSDTCTVYAGTYNESVSVPAGSASNYKIFNVNGSDVVSVLGFTLHSHTQLLGNCPSFQGTTITATCGFFISKPSSPSSASCVDMPTGTTDVYIRSNTMYACGSFAMITATNSGTGTSYLYIQGNTLSYACITQAQAGTATKECNSIELGGDHMLLENNDYSHYTLGIYFSNTTNVIMRGNYCHDQYETEASGNAHTDCFYASSDTGAVDIVVEGNSQYNGVGANAKGILPQGEYAACNGTCSKVLIYRFNLINTLGSGNTSTYGWNRMMMYNNTYYNVGNTCSGCFGGSDNFFTDSCTAGSCPTKNSADLNNIFYYPFAVTSSGVANPTSFDSASFSAGGVAGHNLAYCNASGSSNCALYGNVYEQGTWAGVTGNIIGYIGHSPVNDPKFVTNGSNFHLQAGSPAINAGTYLTTANGAGVSSTALVVNDAAYFQDSYGLSNAFSTVSPDCVSITTVGNHVCVTAVNYTTNTLTLASPISWSNGDHVWLYSKSDGVQVLTGSAPDIGALGPGGATAPSCSPGSGTYSSTQTITCTNPNSGTTVMCYTTNGTTPATAGNGTSCTTGTVYTTTISVASTETLNIIAGTSLLPDSSVVPYVYTLQGSAPTASPVAGTYSGTQSVTLTQAQSQAMCYTTNGTTPASNGSGTCSAGTLYSSPISVSSTETIKAIGMASGWTDSAVLSATYTINVAMTNSSFQGVTLSNGVVIH